ncbi:hypothetical protein HZB96_01215 [Candidatus Gottesmanbacteria bacterium]|nr:hypothetical protein [Candidatus Gottesmanbacteria bacterium]
MDTIISLLNYFGITPTTLTPLVLVWGVGFFIIAKYLKENIEPIKKSIARINNAIIEIQTLFKMNNIPLNHLLTEAPGSPLQPTEYGARIIEESGLKKILDENKEYFLTKLRNSLPKEHYTDYDVQETARKTLTSLKDDPMMNPVKEYAYKMP